MTSKTPVRFTEDIDETALSYAEIKALAAGNPDIIEKTELDSQVAKLKLLKQNHLSQIYDLEDKVLKEYPIDIKRLENKISDDKEDLELLNLNNNADKSFKEMFLNGERYIEKMAGEKIISLCKSMKSPNPQEIGKYKGFKMILSFDRINKVFVIELKNKLKHSTVLGDDINGNILRLDNTLNGITEEIKKLEAKLDDTKLQFENAKQEITRPFEKESELQEKIKRLDELNKIKFK